MTVFVRFPYHYPSYPQAHASLALGFSNLDEDSPTITDCLIGKGSEKLRIDEVIQEVNPSASTVNLSAYLAADQLLIVCAKDFLSVTGLRQLFEILKLSP